MTIAYSQLITLSQPIEASIQALIEAGAESIELMIDGPEWENIKEEWESLIQQLCAFDVAYSVHPPAWDINMTSENRETRNTAIREYERSIRFAHAIGAEHVVIHPGFTFSPVFSKEVAKERAKEGIERLCEVARPLGITLGIENVGYNGSSLFTQAEYVQFVKTLDPCASYLIDTGHAHLNGWDIPALLRETSDRLIALHVHDNDQTGDDHWRIGHGTIPWETVWDELVQLNNNSTVILEYAPGTPLHALKEDEQRWRSALNERQ